MNTRLSLHRAEGGASQRVLFPDTDPISGVLTATSRPTRREWAMTQTLLAALGARLDVVSAGRSRCEDQRLLTAWLTAYNVHTLVLRNADMLNTAAILDSLIALTTGTDTALALVTETDGRLLDWVLDRGGLVHENVDALQQHLATTARPVPHLADGTVAPFPAVLPEVDFYGFRAACRDLLPSDDFTLVDALYRGTFKAVREAPFTTSAEASSYLGTSAQDLSTPAQVVTVCRAAQAAMFTHGQQLKVNLPYFVTSFAFGEHRRLTEVELRNLRAYRTPWRSSAVVLRDADVALEHVTALTLGQVTAEGDLLIPHEHLLSQARIFLAAQRFLRLAEGAQSSDPFIPVHERSVATMQRRACFELGLPLLRNDERRTSRRSQRWQGQLGVTLLPLSGPANTRKAA